MVCTPQVQAAQVHGGAGSGLRFAPVPVRAARATGRLVSAVAPRWGRLRRPRRWFFWVYTGRAFSGVPSVSSGELVSGRDPPGGCPPSRPRGVLVSNGVCLQFGIGCLSAAASAPPGSGCPGRPACLRRGWAGLQRARSAQAFVL